MLPAHDARDLGVERGGAAALINQFADIRDAALASVAAAVSSLSAPPRRRQMDIPRGVCAALAPGGAAAGAGVAGAERHGRPCAARPVSPVVDPPRWRRRRLVHGANAAPTAPNGNPNPADMCAAAGHRNAGRVLLVRPRRVQQPRRGRL